MAYTFTPHIGDGSTVTFPFTFTGPDNAYIRESDIVVTVDGVLTAYTLTGPTQITFAVAPALATTILIRRVMPDDVPYTDFTRGNNFGKNNINNSFNQQLFLLHELLDGYKKAGHYEKQDLDMGLFKVINLGTPTDGRDGVTKSYVDQIVVEAGSASARYDTVLTEGQTIVPFSGTINAAVRNYSILYENVVQDRDNYLPCDSLGTPLTVGPASHVLMPEGAFDDGDVLSISTILTDVYGEGSDLTLNTIADLRAVVDAGAYKSATVLGYYEAGDGGGGPIRVYSQTITPGIYVDNGGSIIVPTGGDGSAAWVWLDDSVVEVRAFGAVGSVYLSPYVDDTIPISNAINVANAAVGVLTLLPGTYRVVPGQLPAITCSVDGPMADLAAYDNTNASVVTTAFGGKWNKFLLRTIIGYDAERYGDFNNNMLVAGTGLEVQSCFYSEFNVSRIIGFNEAIYLNGTVGAEHIANNTFHFGEIRHNNTGLRCLVGTVRAIEANRINIHYFYDNRVNAIYWNAPGFQSVSNQVDIQVMESNVPTGANGMTLIGEVKRNTFRFNSIIKSVGIGYTFILSTAHDNLLQLPWYEPGMISSNAHNIYDVHTHGISDQGDFGATPFARSTLMSDEVPTTGYWREGDRVLNVNPSDGIYGWQCTAGSDTTVRWSIIPSTPDTIAVADGVASTAGLTRINSSSATVHLTLAAGAFVGQEKEFTIIAFSNASSVTVANHETSSPEVFNLIANYGYLRLRWMGNVWRTIDIYRAVAV